MNSPIRFFLVICELDKLSATICGEDDSYEHAEMVRRESIQAVKMIEECFARKERRVQAMTGEGTVLDSIQFRNEVKKNVRFDKISQSVKKEVHRKTWKDRSNSEEFSTLKIFALNENFRKTENSFIFLRWFSFQESNDDTILGCCLKYVSSTINKENLFSGSESSIRWKREKQRFD